jgi:hypothetical protein
MRSYFAAGLHPSLPQPGIVRLLFNLKMPLI